MTEERIREILSERKKAFADDYYSFEKTGNPRYEVYYKSDLEIIELCEMALDPKKVIRCKDCKYLQIDEIFSAYSCKGTWVSPDHYCGFAERKEEG